MGGGDETSASIDPDRARLERTRRLGEARGWLDLLRVAPIILAFALYGLVRIATETFYNELGTTPEEVGLSYLTIVTRASIGVVSVAVILGAYFVVLLTMIRPRRKRRQDVASGRDVEHAARPQDEQGEAKVPSQAQVVLVTLVSAIVFSIFYWAEIAFMMALFALAPFAVAASNEWWRSPRHSLMPAIASMTAFLALAGLAFTGWNAGVWKADEVKHGQQITTDPIFGVAIANASCVGVSWIGGATSRPASLDQPGYTMYLGQAEATMILYRVGLHGGALGLLRLPSSQVALTDVKCRKEGMAISGG
jgi:hypothetical protein